MNERGCFLVRQSLFSGEMTHSIETKGACFEGDPAD